VRRVCDLARALFQSWIGEVRDSSSLPRSSQGFKWIKPVQYWMRAMTTIRKIKCGYPILAGPSASLVHPYPRSTIVIVSALIFGRHPCPTSGRWSGHAMSTLDNREDNNNQRCSSRSHRTSYLPHFCFMQYPQISSARPRIGYRSLAASSAALRGGTFGTMLNPPGNGELRPPRLTPPSANAY
jgi:hypothetical protein